MSDLKVTRMECALVPAAEGKFQLCYYTNNRDKKEHLSLVTGEVSGAKNVPVRIHSECFTGDVLGSGHCGCGVQLRRAMQMIAGAELGLIIYLRQEGRGTGLLEKLQAYNLQDRGYDAVEAGGMPGHQADERGYPVAAAIIRDLGIQSVRLLTDNPQKIPGLKKAGIHVTGRIPLHGPVTKDKSRSLETRVERMNHFLKLGTLAPSTSQGDDQAVILEEAGGRLARAPDHCQRKGRPYVTLSFAQSLDGSIAFAPDKQLLISGKESQILVHKLRALHDGILVGIGTVLADNPRLDVRLTSGKNPQPVVVDSRLRLPLHAHLLKNGKCPPWIMTGEDADRETLEALETAGARVFQLPPDEDGKIRLDLMLARLSELGMHSLMVEGGAEIITHFLNAGLVDQLVLTSAPILIDGLRGISGLKLREGVSFPRLKNISYQLFGRDIVLRGDIEEHAS